MPWFYVDDAFADSKPVMRLEASMRNEAIGLWVRCGAWAAKEETDGRVPLNVVRSFGGTPRLIRALIDVAKLWAPGGDFDENLTEFPPDSWRKTGEIIFKSWGKWQKTRDELQAKRREAADRQKKFRENRKVKGRNAVSSADDEMSRVTDGVTNSVTDDEPSRVTNSERNALLTRDPHARARRPDPTRPLLVTKEGEGYVSSGDDQPPPKTCPRHPDGTSEPCGACAAARKRHDTWKLEERRAAQEAARAEAAARAEELREQADLRAQEIADCDLCDDDGYRPNHAVCDHIDHSLAAKRGSALVREALAAKGASA